jgi:hypothetical protein
LLGPAIFLSFFLLFALMSIAVPVPLFPGNMLASWIGIASSPLATFLGAVGNGLIYGFTVWLVFNLGARRLKKPDLEQKGQKGK